MGINPKQINFLQRLILAVGCHGYPMWLHVHIKVTKRRSQGRIKDAQFKAASSSSSSSPPPGGAPWSPWTYIFFTHVKRGQGAFFRLRNGLRKATEIRGRTDSLSHLLFLAISLIPIPLLRRPSNQNKIVISTGGSFAFLLTAV